MAESIRTVPRRLSGFTQIILATAVAGIAGYVVTWLVPRMVGFDAYAIFAIFWSLLFFVISALSGMQQEVTRATLPVTRHDRRRAGGPGTIRAFGWVAAAATFVTIAGTAALWEQHVFPADGWGLVWPLAVGTATYVLVAVLSGTLYGLNRWESLFWMICTEALLRVAAVAIALLFTSDVVVLAWMTALPFSATLVVLWPFIRKGVVGKAELDVLYRRLSSNITRTVIASASMGLMVSGFPFVLGLTSKNESLELLGLLILAVTLTRAPLIVVMMALQSYLIIHFRTHAQRLQRSVLGILGVIAAAGGVLMLFGWWLGPPVFAFLFPGELVPDGWLISVLVVSATLMGALCVTAPAVLSRSQHTVYSAGWLLAAVTTVVCLMIPMDLVARTVLALLAGPIAGLVVHGTHLAISWRQRPAAS